MIVVVNYWMSDDENMINRRLGVKKNRVFPQSVSCTFLKEKYQNERYSLSEQQV